MPGIRLERNLEIQSATSGASLTYQTVLNYLMLHGFLSPATLDLFRSLDGIESLDLRETFKACSLLLPPGFQVELLQGISFDTVSQAKAYRILQCWLVQTVFTISSNSILSALLWRIRTFVGSALEDC